MSQRTDQRVKTKEELDVYTKCLKLTSYTMERCKPQNKKDKDGNIKENRHNIPARYAEIGKLMQQIVFEMGADILEANEIYVNANLNREDRLKNYKSRVELQNHAIRLTYRLEHMIRVMNDHRPFANNTLTYWVGLLVDVRELVIAWKDRDIRDAKGIS